MITEKLIEVRYAETDKMGIVYHANYLVWFEIARTQWHIDLGYPYPDVEKLGYLSPVLETHAEYGAPMHYGETARIICRLEKITGVRSFFSYEVYRDDETPGVDKPHVTGRSSHCLVTADSFKPLSFKHAIPDLYALYKDAVETAE